MSSRLPSSSPMVPPIGDGRPTLRCRSREVVLLASGSGAARPGRRCDGSWGRDWRIAASRVRPHGNRHRRWNGSCRQRSGAAPRRSRAPRRDRVTLPGALGRGRRRPPREVAPPDRLDRRRRQLGGGERRARRHRHARGTRPGPRPSPSATASPARSCSAWPTPSSGSATSSSRWCRPVARWRPACRPPCPTLLRGGRPAPRAGQGARRPEPRASRATCSSAPTTPRPSASACSS